MVKKKATKKATKAKVTRKKTAVEPEAPKKSAKLEAFLRSIALTYSEDSVSAGIVLAVLRSGTFYASIARYKGSQKTIVVSEQGTTLADALNALSRAWEPIEKRINRERYSWLEPF